MRKTIFLTGGGTGGHIWPLISISRDLRKYRVIFVGEKNSQEEKAAKENKIRFESITAAKIQGWSILNPATWIKQIIGVGQGRKLINKYKPEVIFAKGGFVTFPVVLAGVLSRVRVILHESDSIIGRANKVFLPFAFRFLVGFPKHYYPSRVWQKTIRVGIPIRKEFKSANLPKKKTILFIGGSQGSVFINKRVKELAPSLLKNYRIIHICGEDNLNEMETFRDSLSAKQQKKYQLYGFTDKVSKLIKNSTIVVSRAGATTLAEVGTVGRPIILIPYPYAASDHQLANSQIMANKGGAEMILESQATVGALKKKIQRVMKNKKVRKELSTRLSEFWKVNARNRIKQIIESIY